MKEPGKSPGFLLQPKGSGKSIQRRFLNILPSIKCIKKEEVICQIRAISKKRSLCLT